MPNKIHREVNFTKAQFEKIIKIENLVASLRRQGIEVHGRQEYLFFFRDINIAAAETDEEGRRCLWPTSNSGARVFGYSFRIDDSGADDAFHYPEYLNVKKVDAEDR